MNHYELLGVLPDADEETIRRAILTQSNVWNQRKSMAATMEKRHEADKMVAAIAEARRVLLDAEERQKYDQQLLKEMTTHLPQEVVVPVEAKQQEQATAGAQKEPGASQEEEKRRCPFCGEWILVVAKKCRMCNEWLEKLPEAQPESKATPSVSAKLSPTESPAMPIRTSPHRLKHQDETYDLSTGVIYPCPHCGGIIPTAAIKCRFCGQSLSKGALSSITSNSKSTQEAPSDIVLLIEIAFVIIGLIFIIIKQL